MNNTLISELSAVYLQFINGQFHPHLTVYHLVKRGDSCGRVLSKHECEEAASGLGLNTPAKIIMHSTPPPHCFFEKGRLYFNTAFNSKVSCSDRSRCICKLPCNQEEGCLRDRICGPDKYCHQCINDEHCPGELVCGADKNCHQCTNDEHCSGELFCGLDKRCHEQSGKMFGYFNGEMGSGQGTLNTNFNTQAAQSCITNGLKIAKLAKLEMVLILPVLTVAK